MSRLENLLGAHALALADRLLTGVDPLPGRGLSPSEAAALVTLLAHPGQQVSWLADVMALTSSGATRLVERLVEADWVERSTGNDARSRQLDLSTAGVDRAKLVLADRQAALSSALDCLSPAERVHLEVLLDKLVAGLADDRPTALRVCRLCDRAACCAGRHECPLQHTVPDD